MATNHDGCCVACREAIHVEASVCPHCGSPQHVSYRKRLADALKWAGGVVTVISLIVGAITLASYYQDWRDRNSAVEELVAASSWLVRTRHYSQAWRALGDAIELNPGSANARRDQFDLALVWVREFSRRTADTAAVLDEISTVLYKGLANASPDEVATILAHIAWTQIRRDQAGLNQTAEIEPLFEEALSASPDNSYANAMFAAWQLRQNHARLTTEQIKAVGARFDKALQPGESQPFVRELQIVYLTEAATGGDSARDRALLEAMIHVFESIKRRAEPKPTLRQTRQFLEAYGVLGRAHQVEASLDALPPGDHLALLDWLVEDLDVDSWSRQSISQLEYTRARLQEKLGNETLALASYERNLERGFLQPQLEALLNESIERVSGELPASALARRYINDPIDADDPFAFHLNTLAHFDPKWLPTNLTQAIEFFRAAISDEHARLPELIDTLPIVLARVRAIVRDGEELARANAFHASFSRGHFEIAIGNFIDLSVLFATALQETDALDQAAATLVDATRLVAGREGDWRSRNAELEFALARVHADRAIASTDAADIQRALDHLLAADGFGAVDTGVTSWQEIKGEAFAALRREPEYRELIRGR